ncbi:MAG: SGNH/GDSL hydrolase family protein [Bacteroidales bacterium]|nr:SGNH/GDSL hydrolase family protein [Bacteroidales bacterium]
MNLLIRLLYIPLILNFCFINYSYAQKNADSVLMHSSIDQSAYQEIRGGLANSYLHFTRNKTAKVAFVGGSITAMHGWREKVCQYLIERFPETKFEFVHAGIPSTGSTPGAFRLERDVLSKGKIDLLFEEAAVNDNGQAETTNIHGMEGIVRHALVSNPYTDIILMYFVDPQKIKEYNEGKIPLTIACHDSIARHYQLPSLNLAKEVTDRINAGEFTWDDDFKNLHPSPFGHELYFLSMRALLENCWNLALNQEKIEPHAIPSQMDSYSFTHGDYENIHKANRSTGWSIDKKWSPADSIPTRKGYVDVPMLISSTPGSEITFSFKGTAVGICNVAGPDAGTIEYSIDGGDYHSKDLFSPWSDNLYLNQYLLFNETLSPSKHILKIRISESKNEKSKGHTCQIVHFLVNKVNNNMN